MLVHHHDGRDLQLAQAGETLRNVASVWRAPVHLWTLEEGQGRSIVCKAGEIVVSECAEARLRCGGEAFENEQRAAS